MLAERCSIFIEKTPSLNPVFKILRYIEQLEYLFHSFNRDQFGKFLVSLVNIQTKFENVLCSFYMLLVCNLQHIYVVNLYDLHKS